MKGLTITQELEGFKQIDYFTLKENTLKSLFDAVTFKYLNYDSETNANYFNTGNMEFDSLLEEFYNYCLDKLKKVKK